MRQTSIDDLGEPLRGITFVVVDLETTGGSPKNAWITEIGAVKIRGGETLGEFSTLVNPCEPIPPYISVLTGITNAMVADAPTIQVALPMFLEWARGAVLVAHNAPFDIGFLKAACADAGEPWPGFRTLDTVTLARRVLTGDEVPNRKLGTLAAFFQSKSDPIHRALADARATVDVLHGLLGRLGHIETLQELTDYLRVSDPVRAAKRHLAQGLPHAPGVYVFRDAADLPLYVGTSSNLAHRVSGYFTSSENRPQMTSMVRLATRVEVIECAHTLEAQVRELRLIVTHQPPYNKKSKYPKKAPRPVKDLDGIVDRSLAKIERLSAVQRYEEAAALRSRLTRTLRGAIRLARVISLITIAELVAARPSEEGGWEISVMRYGRLAAAGTSPPETRPQPTLDILLATAETVPNPYDSSTAPHVGITVNSGGDARPGQVPPQVSLEEVELLHAWLEHPGTRLVSMTAGWSSPIDGPGRWTDLLAKAQLAGAELAKTEFLRAKTYTHKWSTRERLDR